MKRLLIISPRFPPKNTADLHRVRMSVRYYRKFDWNPTVLCITPETSDGTDDALLEGTVPADIDIIRVAAWSERKCRRFGFGQIDYRCLIPLYLAGCRLLAERDYDLVFFSSTVFLTFVLGPIWKRRFGCRVVYDFQDPWLRSDVHHYTKANVPGRWWKYRLGQVLAKFGETFALNCADHVISVSEGYVSTLSQRYPTMAQSQFSVIPFGVERHDFELARRLETADRFISRQDGRRQWIYVGRAGPDMNPILDVLFEQIALLVGKAGDAGNRPMLHFIGTNYAPSDRTGYSIKPIAAGHGLQDIVTEHPTRIPYHQVLALYQVCDALLVIGSIHAEYMPSKLFNCVLSEKPVLALFHRESAAGKIAGRFSNTFLATFAATPDEPSFSSRIAAGLAWLGAPHFDRNQIAEEVGPWTAEALTGRQCAVFDRVYEERRGATARFSRCTAMQHF
jgi:hypothetical protein